MSTLEIPPSDWPSFFDSFSHRHDGWLVSIGILSPSLGDQLEVVNFPFRGISLGDKTPDSIVLAFVDAPNQHLSHEIRFPERVWLKQAGDGSDEALEITSADGAVLLTFRSPMPTECVDGL